MWKYENNESIGTSKMHWSYYLESGMSQRLQTQTNIFVYYLIPAGYIFALFLTFNDRKRDRLPGGWTAICLKYKTCVELIKYFLCKFAIW